MQVFISWSGQESRDVAMAVKEWLNQVFQSVATWVSTSDINAGDRSMSNIENGLKGTDFGIICVTPENKDRPWLNFEAGAISNAVGGEAKVAPLLIGFNSEADLKPPLGQFQTSLATRAGFEAIAEAINRELGEAARPVEQLRVSLDAFWPPLETRLAEVTSASSRRRPAHRNTDDKIEEILSVVRNIQRDSSRHELNERTRSIAASIGERPTRESEIRKTVRDIVRRNAEPEDVSGYAFGGQLGEANITIRSLRPLPEGTRSMIRNEIYARIPEVSSVRFARDPKADAAELEPGNTA